MELFDLEICLPVFLEGKWRKRLEFFRQAGLFNTRSVKTRLVILAGTQSEPGLGEGWPVDEVAVMPAHTDEAAAKIYLYYLNIGLAEIGRSRWFLRLDDDSSTNVAGLVSSLDRSYSWREPQHLIASAVRSAHLAQPFAGWLYDLRCPHLVSKHFLHDWEVSATSQAAMLRALCDPRSREILRRASMMQGNWGDIGLAVCCRLAGLSPAHCPFLADGPAYDEFSLFYGEKHYIHGIAPDQEESHLAFTNWLREASGEAASEAASPGMEQVQPADGGRYQDSKNYSPHLDR